MEYLFQAALFLLIAFALLIFGTWRIARGHFAREWDRKIAPAVEAKARAQAILDGERVGFRRGFTAGKVAIIKDYGRLLVDVTNARTVDAITHRN